MGCGKCGAPAKKTAAKKDELLSTGKLAKEVGASAAQVKKAIQKVGLKPVEVRGGCSYYARDAVAKIKRAVAN